MDTLFNLKLQEARHIYTVIELTSLIKEGLERDFYDVWVDGEISNLRVPSSGHIYFTLKDESSQLKVVLFRFHQGSIRFEPTNGMRVIIRGRISVYEPRGEYQLIAEDMEPRGAGALQIAFEQLKERLFKEGLFDKKYKKPIPVLPQRIGIVTSPTGAAIRDILRVIDRRFANIHILIYPVRVQGEGAGKEIAEGIRIMNTIPDIDVLIIGRGGGSLEDLWAFNEEIVARAIFDSNIPIISAVGHEIDYTISDFVADLRAPTPSAAAEMVVKNKESLVQRVDEINMRLIRSLQFIIKDKRDILTSHLKTLFLLSPLKRVERIKETLFNLTQKLRSNIRYRVELLIRHLDGIMKRLNALNPLS
ncbi:MAG: exodeoxyribonuclease VII large subunit, partial [Nitrospinae bacterium]|nr:exodeoxyribonuclease VII large subunit [Nitrospinota bacterium]